MKDDPRRPAPPERPRVSPATDEAHGFRVARPSRRAFLGLLGSGALAGVVGHGVSGAYGFEVEAFEAPLVGLRAPLRVAWLADLHFGPFIRAGSVAAWVDATMTESPDLIVLGGDMVDHLAPNDLRPLFEHVERLSAPLGVFAVWGNQDYARFPDPRDLRRFEGDLSAAGVTVLLNRGVALRDDVFLGGVDSDRVGPMRMRAAISGRSPGSACLLAAHKPKMLLRVPTDVGLTLCGHTHGGQVVVPGVGPLADRSEIGRVSGWVRAPALGYISRGLGVAHVPIRINCPGELTLATLTPA